MNTKAKNIIRLKQNQLAILSKESECAIDFVNKTIDKLLGINEQITENIEEIREAKNELQKTEEDLITVKDRNQKIALKFKTFLTE